MWVCFMLCLKGHFKWLPSDVVPSFHKSTFWLNEDILYDIYSQAWLILALHYIQHAFIQ